MALADDLITSINASLIANLDWLDNAYGKCQKLQREDVSGKVIHYPGLYIGGDVNGGYLELLPDELKGNFCYFDIDDPIQYENIDRNIKPVFRVKIVFWFHWPDVYADWEQRSIEEVKAQVINVLTATHYSRTVEVFETLDNAKSIYQGFTHQEIDRQFLMRPYGGFAIECEVRGQSACAISLTTPTIPINLFSVIPVNYSTDEQLHPLIKRFGDKVYWKSYIFGDGTNTYRDLTGLVVDDIEEIFLSEHTSVNAVTGAPLHTTADFKKNGTGGYHAFTSTSQVQNILTFYYRKKPIKNGLSKPIQAVPEQIAPDRFDPIDRCMLFRPDQ